jgi:hypothetical protein
LLLLGSLIAVTVVVMAVAAAMALNGRSDGGAGGENGGGGSGGGLAAPTNGTGGKPGPASLATLILQPADLDGWTKESSFTQVGPEKSYCNRTLDFTTLTDQKTVTYSKPGQRVSQTLYRMSPGEAVRVMGELVTASKACDSWTENTASGPTKLTVSAVPHTKISDQTLAFIGTGAPSGELVNVYQVIDRNGGDISTMTIGTGATVSPTDRTLVDGLAVLAAQRMGGTK